VEYNVLEDIEEERCMKKFRRSLLMFSFIFLPITLNYFSPYLIIDGLVNKVISAAFITWSLMFFTSLIFGRAFCSYVCPYGGLQVITDGVLQKPLKQIRSLRLVKFMLGIIWIAVIITFFLININNLEINVLYLTENGVSTDNIVKLIFYYVLTFLLITFPIIFGKRGLCIYFCPMSIINIIGTKIKNLLNLPSLRLKATSNNCKSCHKCNRVCPMSIDVMNMVKTGKVNHTDCILCGECDRACQNQAIRRVFGRSK
jgi:polyferredoxin